MADGLPEGFTVDALPPGFTVDQSQSSPSAGSEVVSAVTDIPHKIYEAGAGALHQLNESFNPYSETQRAAMAQRLDPNKPLLDFSDQLASLKNVGSGLAAIPALAASPITGAARSVIGHLWNATDPLTEAQRAKFGVPSGDEAADIAMMGLGPGRGGFRAPVTVPPRPVANGPLGVTLSQGQATGELPLIRTEQAAQRGILGPKAESIAKDFNLQQAQEVASARDRIAQGFDPFNATVAETPQEAGQLVSRSMQLAAAQRKAAVDQAYTRARGLPGDIDVAAFKTIVPSIKLGLSSLPDPIVIDDKLTPFASRALQHIENTISQPTIQNRADPFGQPPNIAGITLKGVDQMRRQLSAFRNDAFASGNGADGRAARAVLNAFDDHIDSAVNSGFFNGDPRAVQAWNDARAAHADYKSDFGKNTNDPVGRVVGKIIGDRINDPAIPNDVADYLYGSSGVNPNSLNLGVAKKVMGILGSQSPEWSAVRQGLFSRLVETPPGVTDWGPARQAQRIYKFLNGDGKEMAEFMYSPAERQLIQQYADLQRRLEVPPGGANRSETSTFVAPMLKRIGSGIAGIVGALIGHAVAPGLYGLGEASGAYAAGKMSSSIQNALSARQVARQMPLVAAAIQKWQKAVAAANKANTPLSNRTAAFATANLGRSLQQFGLSPDIMRSIPFQSPGPAGAQQNQNNIPGPPGQQKNGGKVNGFAHGGAVKLSHTEVAYQFKPNGNHKCSNCSMFRPKAKGPASCTLVKNPIYPTGWCNRWEAK